MTKYVFVSKNNCVPHLPHSIEKALPTAVEKAFLYLASIQASRKMRPIKKSQIIDDCFNPRTTKGATNKEWIESLNGTFQSTNPCECNTGSPYFQSTHSEAFDCKKTFLPVTFHCIDGAAFPRHRDPSRIRDSIKSFLLPTHVFLALFSYPRVLT